ncbi:hypothetical protein EH165_00955 [Nakamurella antarctica]|uniref:Uncharacterized protein n=1 Tax=Nakamurella antarctica TaxID=1902245 RepID=A0A3G8ZIB3_9ACTN|nr:hypothetical protein [Nakamurella antarctica]AZI56950.1 hypothetical protein EH165_00955 [Nakamurella antarctica]
MATETNPIRKHWLRFSIVGLVAVLILVGIITGGMTNVWEWSNKYGTGLAAIAAVVTAVIAAGALQSTAKDSRDRSRPMILAEFRTAPNSDALELVIRNAGPSMARNLRVAFTPELPIENGRPHLASYYIRRQYADPIAVFGPGQHLENVWWQSVPKGDEHDYVNRHKLPKQTTIHLKYQDDSGREYSDTMPLNVEPHIARITVESSESIPGRMKTHNNHLGKLVEAVEALQPNETTT